MELNSAIINVSVFVGGIVVTKIVERFFEKKNKAEDKAESDKDIRMTHLEASMRSMELTLASLTGKLEMVLPHMTAIGKLREDMSGFYAWKREQGGVK